MSINPFKKYKSKPAPPPKAGEVMLTLSVQADEALAKLSEDAGFFDPEQAQKFIDQLAHSPTIISQLNQSKSFKGGSGSMNLHSLPKKGSFAESFKKLIKKHKPDLEYGPGTAWVHLSKDELLIAAESFSKGADDLEEQFMGGIDKATKAKLKAELEAAIQQAGGSFPYPTTSVQLTAKAKPLSELEQITQNAAADPEGTLAAVAEYLKKQTENQKKEQ